MKNINFNELNLKVNDNVNTFKFNDVEIEVLKYLPIEDKYDLIMITLQKAEENSVYNAVKLNMYFHLYLVYMYTNLIFTEEDKLDEFNLYDKLESNGLIDAVIAAIEETEYNELYEYLYSLERIYLDYKNTAGALLQSVINDLPRNAEVAADIVKNFDPKQFQAVVDFAQAANGGRPISGPNANKVILDESDK